MQAKKVQSVPSAPSGSAPSTATLMVPKAMEALAREGGSLYAMPLAVHTYSAFDEKLVKMLIEKPVILVADLDHFSSTIQKKIAEANEGEMQGKGLLLTEGKDDARIPLASGRGFDILDKNASAEFWVFKINKLIEEIRFDQKISYLREEDLKKRRDLDALNEIGSALSTEKDQNKLLDLIVSKSREMTMADAGSLYLIETDLEVPEDPKNYFANKKMRFQVAQNDSRNIPFKSIQVNISTASIYGYVAIKQKPLNFEDVYYLDTNQPYGWGGKDFDAIIHYRTMSMLTVPMINWRGETIGVIQLINRKKDGAMLLDDPEIFGSCVLPFNDHDIAIAMSIASQASIAIQNAQLVSSITGLFDGFIAASVKAIESRDPTTSGHSQRVADLTVGLAEQLDRSDQGKFKGVSFSEAMLQEIRYASLLHDFGKIGVREHVLIKAKKLYPYELQAVKDRFEIIRHVVQRQNGLKLVEQLRKNPQITESEISRFDTKMKEMLEKLEADYRFILQCNEPTVLAQGGFERLKEISKYAFPNWDGENTPYLNQKELISLSVPRGSLNKNDRKEIESHVTHTYKFLATIPWTPDLRNVPEIAYAHHEKLDGTGYPNNLKAKNIPIQSKMMSIADIFDALTANDRPYKKAIPADRALDILSEEAKATHIDGDLLRLFIESEVYKLTV